MATVYSPQFNNAIDNCRNKIGLSNLGNTCYLNAALQVLFNCQRLKSFYLKCPISVSSSRAPFLSDRFKDLVIQLSSDRSRPSLRPYDVLECIRKVNHTFRGFQQQDAQEFLRAFLYEIHEEIKFTLIPDLHYIPRKKHCSQLDIYKKGFKIEYMDEETPSVIMDIFQGSLVSTVECLNCFKRSRREEMFIDISIPINKSTRSNCISQKKEENTCLDPSYRDSFGRNSLSFLTIFLMNWLILFFSYFQTIPSKLLQYSRNSINYIFGNSNLHLNDCLDSFFSEDELTGENQYFCKRCNAACNGVKSTRLFKTPEVLVIHLKRFRNDLMSATKICTPVTFPLKNLDVSPYLLHTYDTKNSQSTDALYDLSGVVCHLGGSSSSGHYISMAYNHATACWMEYDDDLVTEVDPGTVLSCSSSAYILIYSKQTHHMSPITRQAERLFELGLRIPDGPGYHVSKSWLVKLSNFADPGPITTNEFLCPHELFQPGLWEHRNDTVIKISPELWNFLESKFGCNDPIVRSLEICQKCFSLMGILNDRRETEYQQFIEVRKTESETDTVLCAISSVWFNAWRDFIQSNAFKPPGMIDNSKISQIFTAFWNPFQPNNNYELIFEGCWDYLQSIYGGGPKLVLTRRSLHQSSESEIEEPCDQTKEQVSNSIAPVKVENIVTCRPITRSQSLDRIHILPARDSALSDAASLSLSADGNGSQMNAEIEDRSQPSITSSAYWSNDDSNNHEICAAMDMNIDQNPSHSGDCLAVPNSARLRPNCKTEPRSSGKRRRKGAKAH